MSISNFQERFLHGGCAKFFYWFMAVVFVGSLLYMGQQRGSGRDSQGKAVIAATLGTVSIPADAIDEAIRTKIQQQSSQLSSPGNPAMVLPVQFQSSTAAQALNDIVSQSAMVYLARQNGAKLDDDQVRSLISGEIDRQIKEIQKSLVSQGKLKDGASAKEVDDVFKKELKQAPADLRKSQLTQVDNLLGDPTKRENVVTAAAQFYMMDFYRKKVSVSDTDLDVSNSSYEAKSILFKDAAGKKASQQATEAAAEIQGKKLTFEQAIDRYSKDMPQPGKKLSEVTAPLPGSAIVVMPDYAALKGLKAGDVSNPISLPEGIRLYKIVKVTSTAPKDFAKNKEGYRSRLADQLASQMMTEEIKKAVDTNILEWQIEGYKALYQFGKALADSSLALDVNKRQTQMQAVVDIAKEALSKPGPGAKAAVLAEFGAFTLMYQSPGADKGKLAPERIRVINDYLQQGEDSNLRLELVDLYMQTKDAENASDALATVAVDNNTFDATGQALFHTIGQKMDELKAAKLLTDTGEKSILKELDRWKADKADFESRQAEAKKAEAEEHKKAEEEMKASKAKDAAKANAPTSATPKK